MLLLSGIEVLVAVGVAVSAEKIAVLNRATRVLGQICGVRAAENVFVVETAANKQQ